MDAGVAPRGRPGPARRGSRRARGRPCAGSADAPRAPVGRRGTSGRPGRPGSPASVSRGRFARRRSFRQSPSVRIPRIVYWGRRRQARGERPRQATPTAASRRGPASSAARTRADPTTTPSASDAARDAASGVAMPKPIAIGSAPAAFRARRTVGRQIARERRARARRARARDDVEKPAREPRGRAPSGDGGDVGETRKIVSRPAARKCGCVRGRLLGRKVRQRARRRSRRRAPRAAARADAAAQERVQVGEEHEREVASARGSAARSRRRRSSVVPAASARAAARWRTGPSAIGIGERHAELEHVRARRGRGPSPCRPSRPARGRRP